MILRSCRSFKWDSGLPSSRTQWRIRRVLVGHVRDASFCRFFSGSSKLGGDRGKLTSAAGPVGRNAWPRVALESLQMPSRLHLAEKLDIHQIQPYDVPRFSATTSMCTVC